MLVASFEYLIKLYPVQKNVLLGPSQAGLGWPYLAQAGLALP